MTGILQIQNKTRLAILLLVVVGLTACQNVPTASTAAQNADPLHATTQPYGVPSVSQITATLTRIRLRLDPAMTTFITDPSTGKVTCYPPRQEPVTPTHSEFESTGYPSGVAYAGLLAAAEATGDRAFSDAIASRFQFFADTLPLVEHQQGANVKNPYHHWISPASLDSCGAMGAAFIKARRAGVGPDLKVLIDRFADFVSRKQYRLDDGTLARHRPFPQSIWADDMYMGVPILAQMGALTKDPAYFDDAARQVIQISDRLFVPQTGLYTHGCHESIGDDQPHYYWARANGWCAMAMVELLEVLPADHPRRTEILKLLRAQAKGIASMQSGNGLWHQMLDRPDSFLETSASAMFTFAIARGVNRGWLDSGTYAPVALAGWNGITTKIDSTGHITGTCIGTSYAADYPYYYTRTCTDDIHAYGPTLMAGAEIIHLLNNPKLAASSGPGAPVLLREK
jgi:rhamnogalacturonyl hydrolase YesR